MGIEVEKEHTSDEDKARKIALDHLEEVPEYYSKLKKYVEPKKVEENMSYTNHWTQIIRQLINEGHTKTELMKLSDEKLKDLHKEYSGKDDEESQKEAEMIKDILATRGDAGENKEEVKEAIKQLGEAKRRPKVEPIGGNTAPYGYHERVSPSGRKRYVPKTKEEWEAESAAFDKKNPHHWQNVERFQRENPLNPVRDQQYTGVDDHLPGGQEAARERSRAAFARPLPRKVKTGGDAGENKEEEVKEAVIKNIVKKLVKKGKNVATNVGKALIADRDSAYLSRDIKP